METLTAPPIEYAVAAAAIPGQREAGDLHLVRKVAHGVLVGVVDGLGHGAEAAAAARRAVVMLERHAHDQLVPLVRRCHQRLVGTRGVVLSLALLRAIDRSLTWLGIGNVEVLLLRADPRAGVADESLLLRGGVVGNRLPDLQPARLTVERGDTLILATDGIRSDFARGIRRSDPPESIAGAILSGHRKETDDALVLVVRYLGGEP